MAGALTNMKRFASSVRPHIARRPARAKNPTARAKNSSDRRRHGKT
jgi:hypothetical protein